jgi:hypothetical protein
MNCLCHIVVLITIIETWTLTFFFHIVYIHVQSKFLSTCRYFPVLWSMHHVNNINNFFQRAEKSTDMNALRWKLIFLCRITRLKNSITARHLGNDVQWIYVIGYILNCHYLILSLFWKQNIDLCFNVLFCIKKYKGASMRWKCVKDKILIRINLDS